MCEVSSPQVHTGVLEVHPFDKHTILFVLYHTFVKSICIFVFVLIRRLSKR